MYQIDFKKYLRAIERAPQFSETGKVTRIIGNLIQGSTPGANIGAMCSIHRNEWSAPLFAEIVGFKERHILAMPLEDLIGVSMGAQLTIVAKEQTVNVGVDLLGRILGPSGEPIDGKGAFKVEEERTIYANPPPPLDRETVHKPLDLGVRAINAFATVGVGQRIGIFSGSGVGKSVLLGMIANQCSADVNVIALVGERGREVNEFIKNHLGEDGIQKSVVVVVTSDASALLRRRAAYVATTIAEFFRDKGKRVLLMMDSVTRFAMAQREIGLSVGEPPTTKGYPPSAFSVLPRLLERSGNGLARLGGGITGLYTVLVEGDAMDDPVADAVRSILDGHLVLSRELAERNHFPAIDVMASVSRTMMASVSPEHMMLAGKLRSMLAIYRRNEDLITVGAYVPGNNQELDEAVKKIPEINRLLRQSSGEPGGIDETIERMRAIVRSEESV